MKKQRKTIQPSGVVLYLRVSRPKRNRATFASTKDLGVDSRDPSLENQQAMGYAYAERNGLPVAGIFQEVESGTNCARPQLRAAIAFCLRNNHRLVVATVSRLARNARFLAELNESDLDFVCLDVPDMNKMVLGVMAALAEQEADAASTRTTQALAVLKARGVKLGSPGNFTDEGRRIGAMVSRMMSLNAREWREAYGIALVRRNKGETFAQIAAALNAKGLTTPRGKAYAATTVMRLLQKDIAG